VFSIQFFAAALALEAEFTDYLFRTDY